MATSFELSPEQAKRYNEDGCLVVENFLSDEEVEALREECHLLVDDMNPNEHHTVFSTEKSSYRDDYFITSGDKIAYFFEDGVFNDEGNLAVEKHLALNKIGHALHVFCPNFKKVTFSDKAKSILRKLDYKDPVVMQSMYIFKQPKVGGLVIPHQDATFLYMEPDIKLMGLWLALEDATLENGCLHFIPGSHKNGLNGNYRMVRNSDPAIQQSCVFTGEKPTYDDTKFVPAPVKKGSLVLINGLVVHKSSTNKSNKSRHAYTFHLYDNHNHTWDKNNWLQPTEKKTFSHVYEQ